MVVTLLISQVSELFLLLVSDAGSLEIHRSQVSSGLALLQNFFCRSQYAPIFSNVEFRDRKVELREWKLAANYRNYCRALYNLLGSKKLLINHSSNSIVELKRMGDNSLYRTKS